MNSWTLRLIAAMVLTACCALCGRALCGRERRRVLFMESMKRALPMLSIDMLERLSPLSAALKASAQPLLVYIARAMDKGMGASEAWTAEKDALIERGQMLDCLLPEDLARLDMLFGGLGASGLSAQRQLLTDAGQAFSGLLEDAKKRADERGKLYTNLGLLAGLALSVCML